VPNAQVATPSYTERVLPSAVSLLPVLIIFPTMYLTLLLINQVAGILLGLTVTVAVLASIWFAAPLIQMDSKSISVGDVVLPKSVITHVRIIYPREGFQERGPKLSPAAFTKFQISVKTMIRIEIDDPTDSTPYWLIATRNPETIKALLESSSS